jgi:hypothetical protein
VSENEIERFLAPNTLDVVGLTKVLDERQLSDISFSLRLKCVASVFTFSRMTEVLLIEQRLESRLDAYGSGATSIIFGSTLQTLKYDF